MILIKLKEPRRTLGRNDSRIQQKNYTESQPFFSNPRGVLAHRVKSVFRMVATYANRPWWIVEYWCENSGVMDKSGDGLASHPGDRYVCARCEERAIRSGEKSSSELVGRHVCIGVARAVSVCRCKNESVATQDAN